MTTAFLLLGSNEGMRMQFLQDARQKIDDSAGQVISTSSIYETAPWGNTDQGPFLNQVIEISTSLEPLLLLGKLQDIETNMGRIRKEKWGPRRLDIDILFYGSRLLKTPLLTIPHPGIPERRFTLVPLVEIAEGFVHPVLKKSMKELLAECKDTLGVERFTGV
jgi:2-amino-4-hydroxy-6-hydroxymethyldihydropteridine diphosphokinase